MGKALGTILSIAVAVFAPYAAAALGLTGFAATAFGFVAQGLVGKLVGGSSLFGGGQQGAGTQDSGLLLNQQSTSEPVYIIYGERRIGGNRVYINTTNGSGDVSGNEYLHSAFTISEGEVGWINAVLLQGNIAWIHPKIIDDPDNVYFAADEETDFATWQGKYDAQGRAKTYSSLMSLSLYRGTETQNWDDAWYQTESDYAWFSDEITGDFSGAGIAWAYLRLQYDRDKFPGAPNVQFDVVGKRIYNLIDTDDDLDPFDNKVLARNDTWENLKSDLLIYKNPANVLHDYLTNSRYGKGLSESVFNGFEFAALRTYTYNKGLEVNGALDPQSKIFDNTQLILNTANAFLVYSQGKYGPKPLAELVYDEDTYLFNEDNILGDWNISLGSKRNKQNKIKINYFNPLQNWQRDIITFPEDDLTNPYLIADNNVVNERQIDLPLTSEARQASAIGEFLLKVSRYQDVVSFKTTWDALRLQVGDPVYVTHPRPGWINQPFRVVGITLQQDGTVDVTLLEYPDTDVWIPDHTY